MMGFRSCLAAWGLLVSCTTAPAAAPPVEVRVDPRIELASVVFHLSGERLGWTDGNLRSEYRTRALETFAPYRKHPAVKAAAALRAGYSDPAEAILHFGNPPDLAERAPIPADAMRALGGEEAVRAWIEGLRAFARDTSFMAWFASERVSHEAMAEEVWALLAPLRVGDALADYYGGPTLRTRLILAPLVYRQIGFGPQVVLPDGVIEAISVQGPKGVRDGMPYFVERGTEAAFVGVLLHEFGHSVVNPSTARVPEHVAALAPLYDPIRKEMRKAAYGTWQIALNEHLVRASTIRIAALRFPPEMAAGVARSQRAEGFAYLDILVRGLQEDYEARRAEVRTWTEALPALLERLEREGTVP